MEEKKKIEPVVTGPVKIRKKSLMEKIGEAFISVDFKEAVKDTNTKLIIPIVKKTFIDVVNNTLNTMLFGNNSSNAPKWFGGGSIFGGGIGYSVPTINYSGISTALNSKPAVPAVPNIPTYDEIVLASKEDADRVLDTLQAQLERFGSVTISDLYEAVGLPAVSTHYNYGWKNLAGAGIGIVSGGYLLKLPTAIPLN